MGAQGRQMKWATGALAAIVLLAVVLILTRGGGDGASSRPAEDQGLVADVRPPKPETASDRVGASVRPSDEAMPVRVASGVTLRGRVTAADSGAVIAGATIALHVDDERGALKSPRFSGASEPDGTYRFGLEQNQMPRRDVVAVVRAKGYAAQIVTVLNNRSRGEVVRDFELKPSGAITGVVQDPEGAPIANATIGRFQTIRYSGIRSDNPNEFFPSTTSGADGRFSLDELPLGEPVRLLAQEREHLPAITDAVAVGTEGVVIELKPGEAAITGKVEESDGRPAPNVPVRAVWMGKSTRPNMMNGIMEQVPNLDSMFSYTDEQGRFEFPALKSGWQALVAGVGMPVGRSVGDLIMMVPGDEKQVTLRFREPVTIAGVVVDKATQAPMPGVRLKLESRGIGPNSPMAGFAAPAGQSVAGSEVLSNYEGRFELQADRTVEMEFGLMPSVAYKPAQDWKIPGDGWLRQRLQRNVVMDGAELKLEITPPVQVTGIVMRPGESGPAVGATVSYTAIRGGWRGGGGGGGRGAPGQGGPAGGGGMPDVAPSETVTTDAQGQFTITVLPGVNVAMQASSNEGRASARADVSDAGTVEAPIRIVLESFGEIVGVVTRADGTPAAGVSVSAMSFGRRGQGGGMGMFMGGGGAPGGPGGGAAGPGGGLTATTGEDGGYSIKQVPAGRARVTVQLSPGLPTPEAQTIEIAGGETPAEVNFTLPPTAGFQGVVVEDISGEPVTGAMVTASAGGGNQWGGRGGPGGGGAMAAFFGGSNASVETNAEGKWTFANLPADQGVYTFTATHPSYDEARVENLILADSPTTIRMKRRGRIALTVVEGSQTVRNFEYVISSGNAGGWRTSTLNGAQRKVFDQQGPVLESLSAGKYSVHVYGIDGDGNRDARYGFQEVELTPESGEVPVEVALGALASLRGVVVNTDGSPIEGAQVTLRRRDLQGGRNFRVSEGNRYETQSGSDGAFVFESIAAGSMRVEAQRQGFVQTEDVNVDVEPGKQIEAVTVKMAAAATVYGKVLDVDGAPMANTVVAADGREGTTNEAGEYEIRAVSPGRRQVAVRIDNRPNGSQTVELAAGERKEVNFDFKGMIELRGLLTVNGSASSATVVLKPETNNDGNVRFTSNRTGAYVSVLEPGTYKILVTSRGGRITAETDMSLTIASTPTRQVRDLELRLERVDGVIVMDTEDVMERGELTIEHRSRGGQLTRNTFNWEEKRFQMDNMPHGSVRGTFKTRTGRQFISDWIPVDEGSEKMLFLVPGDLLGGS